MIRKGKGAAYRRTHVQILLQVEEGQGGPALRDGQVADQLGVHERTVSRLRERCVTQGLEAALGRKKHCRTKPRVLDGDPVAMMCSKPPLGQARGQARWTLRLLSQRLAKLGVVERSREKPSDKF